jgi:hypothetical protein
MEPEKSLFNFRPDNRIIETRFSTYDIMTDQGWGSFQIPYQVITGWKEPKIREAK